MKLEEEEKFMTRSLELCDSIAEGDGLDPKLEKYYSLIYLARTKYLLNKDKDGEKLINQAFTMRDAQDAEESGVAQIGFMLLSISLPDVDEQISALENAFLVCRSHWIKPLRALFTKLYRQKRYEKLVDTVNKTLYTYLITNHTWNLYYREAGKHTNRIKEVVSTYEALLQALSISRSHTSTMKFQLALTHRRFTGDVTEAKRLFYEILDADDCRDPFTEERYDWVLVKSQIEISEILWAQFREAECLQDKESFLQELSSLTDHKLAQNLTVDEVWGAYDTTLARMHMKIGPLKQFVDTLDRSFQACLMSLQDDNPWNDQETLRQLSKTLACLPGLGEDISIALSSQFYFLSGKGLHHKQPNDDHEPISQYDDSGSDTMRFDDIGDSSIQCTNPVCRNRVGIKKKEMVAFYYCLICVDTSICKACILDIQDLDGQQQSRDQLYPYCGPQHLRVSVPIQGWKGVREGIVNIQGRDPISFVEWLDNLKRKKWPEAWKRFMRQ
jgi:hypothetical protein